MKLDWELRGVGYRGDRQECWIASNFCIAIDRPDTANEEYGVMIHGGRDAMLYRSKRTFPEAEAKVEAIRHGARIARKQARTLTQVADLLKRQDPTHG